MIAAPLHTGTVRGAPVRFFRSPIEDGRPDMPWVAWDDLTASFPLPAGLRDDFRRGLRAEWGDASRTVATSAGPAVVVPHFAAQGFIHAMAECFGMDAEGDYATAGAEALERLTAHLTFPDGVLAFSAAALRRWDAEGGGR